MQYRLSDCLVGLASIAGNFLTRLVFSSSLATLACVPLMAQQQVTLPQIPRAVQNGSAQLTGHYDLQQMLRLVITLRPPHMAEEEEFLRQLQDPDSPQYHQYLSQQQWNERFSPSVEDEQAVVSWAQSQGLTVTGRYPNRLLVEVDAPVATIEKDLHVTINAYQMGSKSYFSNDRGPSIPASLATIVHNVLGLNNIMVVHVAAHGQPEPDYPVYSPGPSSETLGTITADGDIKRFCALQQAKHNPGVLGVYGGYDPTDLYKSSAYNYAPLKSLGHCCNPLRHPNVSPPESSIAIVTFGDYLNDDVRYWAQAFGFALYVTRIHIGGTPPPHDPETTLDVEYATAMANSFTTSAATAAVYSYQAANRFYSTLDSALNTALTDGKARVLNMSWGAPEKDLAQYDGGATIDDMDNIFRQMVGQGWTLVAASGDGGATTGCASTQVSFPASDPYVTAVGGTSLSLSGDTFNFEHAWHGIYCTDNDGGTGGGCSSYFSAPHYQGSVACGGNKRSVPDLALNSNFDYFPQSLYLQGWWWEVGGTSVAAPEISGFFAQENAYLLAIQSFNGNTCGPHSNAPCAPLGTANPDLYWAASTGQVPHYPFYDLTQECNNNDITGRYHLQYYCAARGYDRATGWGSANMLQLAWTLNFILAGDWSGPTASFSGPPVDHWYNTDQTVNWTLTDSTATDHHPIGVAGFSAAWDADPGDPYSEPTPGTGTNYYGPQVYGSSGSQTGLYLLSQGCHTVYVRSWDNGGNSTLSHYGPLCLDTLPPTVVINASGNLQSDGNYIGPVLITISATDSGSGVASLTYWVDNQQQGTYSQPFYIYTPGRHIVSVIADDKLGNSGGNGIYFTIDSNTQYTLSITKSGSGSGTVTSTDGGINCGNTCSASYYDEQPVTLTASPSAGSLFTGWRNCDLSFGFSCTLTVTAARNVTAVFNIPVALQFVPLTPCRVVDTRRVNGPFGGPTIAAGTSRDFAIPNGPCAGIPANAAAYSLNVTTAPHGYLGYLSAWPTGFTRPLTSVMNSFDGRIKANAAILPAGDNTEVSVYVSNTADVVIDIDGYFKTPDSSTLAFFPLTPCRVIDTRNGTGDLSGPYLSGGVERDFPVLESSCVAQNANIRAYSFNVTVVPHQPGQTLGYLTLWPEGDARPAVSTLNNLTGTIVANGALVPAGTNGGIAAFPDRDTDLVVDINGYFADPSSHSQPLSLYTFAPCRVLDTRQSGGAFTGQLTIDVPGSPCEIPGAVKAYVFNATVLPSGALSYLVLWPHGDPQPLVSTLNALDGAVTSNMAIVPTTDGSIEAYAAGLTQLILDISSYFAP